MNPDFVDLLRALSGAGAEFLVFGAYAVGIHGHPRATKDLDVWVNAMPANAELSSPHCRRSMLLFWT